MPHAARADLESLLQTRRLDHTLTSVRPSAPAIERLATGLPDLDRYLDGGIPRGQLSELVGARSSGRTSFLTRLMAAATAQGELVALVDGLDRFDPPSAAAAGVTLDRLLWIRGHLMSHPGFGRDLNQRALTQALDACALVLQSGGFALVALDLGGLPSAVLRRVPFTTWRRLQRMVEGSRTACVLLSETSIARSPAGLTVTLTGTRVQGAAGRWAAPAAMPSEGQVNPERGIGVSARRGWGPGATEFMLTCHTRRFDGLTIDVRAVHARTRWAERSGYVVETAASRYV